MDTADIEKLVWDAIRKTINKFREQPLYFFTESDIVSYLWMSLYTSKLEATTKDGKTLYLVHREYPTNFRYDKANLPKMEKPYELMGEPALLEAVASDELDIAQTVALLKKIGSRGHYDLVVLSPDFVENASVKDVINKDIRSLELRHDPDKIEILFSIEFKYIISSSSDWQKQIDLDNRKLAFAKKHGNAKHAVNLVFCNVSSKSDWKTFKNAVQSADPVICSAFIQACYDEAGIKHTQKPEANTPAALAQIGY